MAYIKKGGHGGDRHSSNVRKSGQGHKQTAYAKMFYDIHFKNRKGVWLPRTYRSHPACPSCGNDNGEFLTELRESFFHCEKCKHNWDIER